MGLLLPEAADSRWIDPARIDDPAARAVLLRMRLYVLIRLLFGQRIFINEGWSLDSVAFQKVASEVIAAIETMRPQLGGALDLSPFRIEARSGATTGERLRAYLRRGESMWSGMPQLRDREVERDLLASLDDVPGDRFAADDRVRRALTEAGIAPWQRDAFLDVARYLDDAGYRDDRLAPSTMAQVGHFAGLRPRLIDAAPTIADGDVRDRIARFIDRCDAHATELRSTSSVEHLARAELDGDALAFVTHLSRLHYMLATTHGQGAAVAGPTFAPGDAPAFARIDQAVAGTAPPQLEFAGPLDTAAPIAAQLAELELWGRPWQEVIALTQRKDWREAVAAVRADYRQMISRPNIFATRSFDRLERLLEKHCPSLVIRRSFGETLGISPKVSTAIEAATGPAVVGGVGTLIGMAVGIPPPLAALAGGAVGKAVQTVAGRLIGETRPLTGKYGAATSIFRVAAY